MCHVELKELAVRPETTIYCVVMDMWPGSLNCCVFHLSNGAGRVCLDHLQGLFSAVRERCTVRKTSPKQSPFVS